MSETWPEGLPKPPPPPPLPGRLSELRVLVKGAGELASAVIHRLYRAGFPVVATELPMPLAVRRGVSFCTAVREKRVVVDGVEGRLWPLVRARELETFDWSHVPVFVDPDALLRRFWRPHVIVDGRMAKRNLDNEPGDAPLVVALGPGIHAGRDVHYVVETNRGHDLGRIIVQGPASPDTGTPGLIAGRTAERVLRAPADGAFEPLVEIGARVSEGQVVARVAGQEVRAPFDGVVRGLVFPGTPVDRGLKVGDVDPRGDPSYCWRISDKARAIAGSVLEVVVSWYQGRPEGPRAER